MHIYHFSHDVVIFHTCIFFLKKKKEWNQTNEQNLLQSTENVVY